MMKRFFIAVIVIVVMFGVAFLVDQFLLDQGEDLSQVPDIGIKQAVLDPAFVTKDGQPLLSVYVKGGASRVEANIAKRVAPTKGGDTIYTYELSQAGMVPAESVTENESGEFENWNSFLEVPEDEGQYLLTIEAYDQKDVVTKFKMFNYILVVQPESDKVAGNTPGQSAFLDFAKLIEAGELEAAYDFYDDSLQVEMSLSDFEKKYENIDSFEVKSFSQKDLTKKLDTELIVLEIMRGDEKQEYNWQVAFEPNGQDVTAKWQIKNIKEINND